MKKLKRYPKAKVIEYARKRNTKRAARRMAWLDAGGYSIGDAFGRAMMFNGE